MKRIRRALRAAKDVWAPSDRLEADCAVIGSVDVLHLDMSIQLLPATLRKGKKKWIERKVTSGAAGGLQIARAPWQSTTQQRRLRSWRCSLLL